MAVKFKAGDKIRRNKPGSIKHGQKAVVQSVVQASNVGDIIYVILTNNGQGASWYGKYCELVIKKEEKQENPCRCDLQVLMRQGCQCGCKI